MYVSYNEWWSHGFCVIQIINTKMAWLQLGGISRFFLYPGNSCFHLLAKVPLMVLKLQVHVPSSCMLDGVHSQHFLGTGVIVYHSETMGLVAVDKNTVAVPVSDVMISFAAFPIEIPAEVRFYGGSFLPPVTSPPLLLRSSVTFWAILYRPNLAQCCWIWLKSCNFDLNI